MNNLRNYQLWFSRAGNVVRSGLTVNIYDTSLQLVTCYNAIGQSGIVNPVTSGVFAGLANGVVNFFSYETELIVSTVDSLDGTTKWYYGIGTGVTELELEEGLTSQDIATTQGYSITGNTLTVTSAGGAGDRFATVQAAIAYWFSEDRDSELGIPAEDNWRIVTAKGSFIDEISTIAMSRNYCRIEGPAYISKGSNDGTPTIYQTANTVQLKDITIENTGSTNGDWGLMITAADNTESYYDNCHFKQPNNAGAYDKLPVGSKMAELNGTWRNCTSTQLGWRTYNIAYGMYAKMYFCESDIDVDITDSYGNSFGGDNCKDVGGEFYFCKAKNYAFGGCSGAGSPVSGTLINCEFGDKSVALQRNFTGYAENCKGGTGCFSGIDGVFSGTAINCSARKTPYITAQSELASFGQGTPATSYIAGTLINCKIEDEKEYQQGITYEFNGNLSPTKASLRVYASPALQYVTIAADAYGEIGNDISVEVVNGASLAVALSGTKITITAVIGTTTLQQVSDALNADGSISAIITSTYSAASSKIAALSETNLAGGYEAPNICGCNTTLPSHKTADFAISGFYNGQTFTNYGASAAVAFTLPDAVPGQKYIHHKMANKDYYILPKGTDTIASQTNIANIASETNVKIELVCLIKGNWLVQNTSGTWAYVAE